MLADVGRPQQRWQQQQQQQRCLCWLRAAAAAIVNNSPSALSSSRGALGTLAIFNCVVLVVDGRRRSSKNCRESAVIEAVSEDNVSSVSTVTCRRGCRPVAAGDVMYDSARYDSCYAQYAYYAEILILFRWFVCVSRDFQVTMEPKRLPCSLHWHTHWLIIAIFTNPSTHPSIHPSLFPLFHSGLKRTCYTNPSHK